jgi:hypothetical protein
VIVVSLRDKDLKQYLVEKELGMPVIVNPTDDTQLSIVLGACRKQSSFLPTEKCSRTGWARVLTSNRRKSNVFSGLNCLISSRQSGDVDERL